EEPRRGAPDLLRGERANSARPAAGTSRPLLAPGVLLLEVRGATPHDYQRPRWPRSQEKISRRGAQRTLTFQPPYRLAYSDFQPRSGNLAPNRPQLRHLGERKVLILTSQIERHVDEINARRNLECHENGTGQIEKSARSAGTGVVEPARGRVLPQPQKVIDAVADEHEIAQLPAVGKARIGGAEQL